jgi:hypothetical protein
LVKGCIYKGGEVKGELVGRRGLLCKINHPGSGSVSWVGVLSEMSRPGSSGLVGLVVGLPVAVKAPVSSMISASPLLLLRRMVDEFRV